MLAVIQPRPFPITCPQCLKTDGWPFRVTPRAQNGGVEIDLRCRACGHDWTDEMNKGTLSADVLEQVVLRAKADRRHTPR